MSHTPISKEKLEAMRSISFIGGGLPSKPKVREWRDETSGRMKATTDEVGNTVTQHGNVDRQDVHINANTVTMQATPKVG
jgi:hypothetical protein